MTRLLLALAVLAAPVAALAQCPHADQTEAMSCVEGSQWDPATGTCVPVVTG
jgi:hypothetical protein